MAATKTAETKPIRVPPQIHSELKALAARKGTLLVEEAQKAIAQYLQRETRKIN